MIVDNTPNAYDFINKDESSIYLTSNQLLPQINSIFSSLNNNGYYIDSYVSSSMEPPTSLQAYNNPQIVLNSDRILLNAVHDSIILSAPTGDIHLSSNSNIHLDSEETIIDSKTILLGNSIEHIEPMVLGNKLQGLLLIIMNMIFSMNESLRTAKTEPVVQGAPASMFGLNSTAEINKQQIEDIAKFIADENILSKNVFVKP